MHVTKPSGFFEFSSAESSTFPSGFLQADASTKIKHSIPGGTNIVFLLAHVASMRRGNPPGMLCLIFVDASACRNPVRRWIYSGSEELEIRSVTSGAHAGSVLRARLAQPLIDLLIDFMYPFRRTAQLWG